MINKIYLDGVLSKDRESFQQTKLTPEIRHQFIEP